MIVNITNGNTIQVNVKTPFFRVLGQFTVLTL